MTKLLCIVLQVYNILNLLKIIMQNKLGSKYCDKIESWQKNIVLVLLSGYVGWKGQIFKTQWYPWVKKGLPHCFMYVLHSMMMFWSLGCLKRTVFIALVCYQSCSHAVLCVKNHWPFTWYKGMCGCIATSFSSSPSENQKRSTAHFFSVTAISSTSCMSSTLWASSCRRLNICSYTHV